MIGDISILIVDVYEPVSVHPTAEENFKSYCSLLLLRLAFITTLLLEETEQLFVGVVLR